MYNHLEKGQGAAWIRRYDHEKLWGDRIGSTQIWIYYIPCFPMDVHTLIDKGLYTHDLRIPTGWITMPLISLCLLKVIFFFVP